MSTGKLSHAGNATTWYGTHYMQPIDRRRVRSSALDGAWNPRTGLRKENPNVPKKSEVARESVKASASTGAMVTTVKISGVVDHEVRELRIKGVERVEWWMTTDMRNEKTLGPNERVHDSSRLSWPHLISSEPSASDCASVCRGCDQSDETTPFTSFWSVAATANWVALRRTRCRSVLITRWGQLRRDQMRWDEWYERPLMEMDRDTAGD